MEILISTKLKSVYFQWFLNFPRNRSYLVFPRGHRYEWKLIKMVLTDFFTFDKNNFLFAEQINDDNSLDENNFIIQNVRQVLNIGFLFKQYLRWNLIR